MQPVTRLSGFLPLMLLHDAKVQQQLVYVRACLCHSGKAPAIIHLPSDAKHSEELSESRSPVGARASLSSLLVATLAVNCAHKQTQTHQNISAGIFRLTCMLLENVSSPPELAERAVTRRQNGPVTQRALDESAS